MTTNQIPAVDLKASHIGQYIGLLGRMPDNRTTVTVGILTQVRHSDIGTEIELSITDVDQVRWMAEPDTVSTVSTSLKELLGQLNEKLVEND
ncbi:hypothetical protein SEA_NEOBUSH_34 [Gordonia phage Neobush]|uniref:Uncharacterized protein n=9 Tax=Nymphadoravirus TaxID=2169636 RepID=A0A4Y5TYE6_9CAUD|nr:hypothetical protein SEA_KITA_34 [Gordonia phage Kita]YP_010653065.1 hypothetical protein PP489_gp31 [Gordonia phage Polly]YP_010653144.1 hypothetical protein PP490_gp34 [Gordonia phage Maridalia]QCG77453.1 hypothetical protein SEA_ANTONIO_34 [Gordonia phage Antonio]QCW22438.1 hypothetical protein SEA_TAYONIA_34 [Gordonia phage Tayonia]QDF16515.1 hypothetical protein SEA_ZAMEEN_34 [Gordonia phage Zameen]QDH48860.1 hypothetical protein SEA_SUSCEPIT_34 [Gordonia phage Suscepit]QUE26141.1 hy